MGTDLKTVVYILHLDGTPVLRVDTRDLTKDSFDGFMGLFGGFSSAINTLVQELGHKEIKSIRVGDGVLVYSSTDPLLFVVHINDPKYEQFSKLLVEQVEHEFFDQYEDTLEDDNVFVFCDIFNPFKSTVMDIYNNLLKLDIDHPDLLDFLPEFIPLSTLHDVLNMGLDLIKGYPNDTIKLVRKLEEYFKEDTDLTNVALTLGRYSGHKIAKERYHSDFMIDADKVLKLLNEISIVRFDPTKELFDFQLCPVCRGKQSEKPMCHFFSGFIEGAIDNPSITVNEVTCKARGDKSCSFKLIRG